MPDLPVAGIFLPQSSLSHHPQLKPVKSLPQATIDRIQEYTWVSPPLATLSTLGYNPSEFQRQRGA
jgi:hypothetical protein